jgi:FHS family Na+ dependent glucose MFS transporter 1
MKIQSTTMPIKPSLSTEGRMVKTLGYYAAFIVLGLVAASLGPTLPGLAEHTHSRLGEISFLFTARSLGFLLGALWGGRLYDRVPGHLLIGAVLGIMAVLMACVPLVSILWLLTGILLILGIVESFLDMGGNTLLVWVHRREVGPFMNGLHFFFGLGAFLSPIIIAQTVVMSGDITWAYWTLSLLMLPVAVWIFSLPSPAPQRVSEDQRKGQINYPLVVLIGIFFLLYVGAEVGFGGWIFTYVITLDLMSVTLAAYVTSAFWGALTVGRLLSIPLATRFRPVVILFSSLAGCLLSMGIMLLWSNSLVAIWVGTFGLGVSMASIFPTMLSFSGRRMTITGQVTGWFFAGASLGGMSLPWLIGQFIESIGPQVMMIAILAALIGTVIVLTGIFFAFKDNQAV